MNSRAIKLSLLAVACLAAAGVFLLSNDTEPPIDPTLQAPIADPHDPADAMRAEATDRGFVDSERVALEDEGEPLPPPQLTRLAVTGRVVNGARTPVAGASVSLRLRRNVDRGQFGGRGGFGGADFRELFRMQPIGNAVITGSDGGFSFETTEAFSDSVLAVLVSHEDYALESVNRNWTVEDGALALGDIVVSQGGTIIGHVVDEGEVSIRDAKVRVVAGGGGPGRGGRGGFGGFGPAADPTALPAANTDALGSFRLQHVHAGSYTIEARAEGFPVAFSERVEVKEGEQVDAGAIRLEHGALLTGTVTDGRGLPIAGALVKVEASRRAMFESFRNAGDTGGDPANAGGRGGRGGRGGAMNAFGRMFADDAVETRTSGNGKFRFDAVVRTGVRVTVTHELFIDEERDPVYPLQTPDLQVQMERRLVVEGVVLDERTGKPIDLFGIQARRVGGVDGNDAGDPFGRGGRGGRGGNRGGPGGNRGNTTDAAAAAPTAEELARQQERDTRNAEREAQRARERAFQQSYLGASGEVPRDTPPPTGHEDGRFVIDGLLDGEYLFDIDAPGYVKMAAGPVMLQRRQDRTRVTFRMARGVGAEGIVVEARTGEPIVGARVELMLPELAGATPDANGGRGGRGGRGGGFGRGGGPRSTVVDRQVTGADGRFQLRPQREANYVLQVSKNNFLPYTDANLRLGQTAAKLEVTLLAGARVHGNVVGLNPGEAARVVFSRTGGDRRTANVDPANAAYEIKGLEAGSYFVRVERNDGDGFRSRIGAAVAMRQGEPDLVLTAGADVAYNPLADRDDLGAVEGSITISLGSLAGLQVRLQPVDEQQQEPGPQDQPGGRRGGRGGGGRMSRFLRSDVAEDGTFKIESIPPDSYFLEVSRGGDRGGSTLHRRQINVQAGPAQRQDLRLSLGSLEMDAKDAEGKPIDRARVNLVLSADAAGRPADQWPQLPSYRSLTLRDGKLISGEVEIGTYLYSLSGRNLPTQTGEIQVVTGAPSRVEVQFKK